MDDIEQHRAAHAGIGLRLDAGAANRVLTEIEHLDQQGGIAPALADLRERLKAALALKSSGDTVSAPSTE